MVGPRGLEPQTSTVSISKAIWEPMRCSEYELHGHNWLARNVRPFSWQRYGRVGGVCWGEHGRGYVTKCVTKTPGISHSSGSQRLDSLFLARLQNLLVRDVTQSGWLSKPDAVAAVRFRLIERQIHLAQNLFDEIEIPISA
jgi:hypothetical protein